MSKNSLDGITVREGDEALNQGVKEFLDNTKASVAMRYNLADKAAEVEKPVFDLSSAVDKGKQIKTLVLGETKDIRETVTIPAITVKGKPVTKPRTKSVMTEQLPLNVADTPVGKLITIINDIEKLKPLQNNYEVVKQLRTRVGDLVETWPWEATVNKGQVRSLYGTLSHVLDKPVNNAPNFTRLHQIASSSAKARYEFLDAPSIQKQVKFEPSGKLIKTLSVPNELTPMHIAMFKSPDYPKDKLLTIQKGIKSQILLDSGGAVKALEKWENDKPAWEFLTGGTNTTRLKLTARNIDKLVTSNLGKMVESERPVSDVINQLLLKPHVTPEELADTAKMLGPRGTAIMRRAIYRDILTKSESSYVGIPIIDKTLLNNVLKTYKDKGILNSPFLTNKDRIKLRGLKSYEELIFFNGKDPGVSLEAAQLVTQMKHPSTFIAGAQKLTVNEVMAKFLSSKTADAFLLGNGKKQLANDPLIRTFIITKALLEGTNEGNKELPALPLSTR